MSQREYYFHNGKKGAAIAVRVVSDSLENEIADILQDGTLQIHLTAPYDELGTNQALAEFLAKVLKVPKSKVEIVAGLFGQDKLVSILDMDAVFANKKILEYLS